MSDRERRLLVDEEGVRRLVRRMAAEIVRQVPALTELLLVGIHRRGVQLADLLAREIGAAHGAEVATGSLDITLYRDDLMAIGPRPVVGQTRLPTAGIDGKVVVVVDDVLYTGRTVRAALDELADFGRPRRILLAVLVDRGGRELPIHPDVVGETIEVQGADHVDVLVRELDGRSAVELVKGAQ